jgi:2-succinyl-5-enolpyruvyl-6-hydroxy-3-cyclohexene-1-carboxylate synthase
VVAPRRPSLGKVAHVTDRNYRFAVPLIRALASLGVAHACVTPGSRSTPLALALADEPGITVWTHHDERSAGFFALGIAKTTGTPALVVCTSGTAAAELLPAVVEARHGRLGLLVITADRPADLVGVGAPQTIDQHHLFGTMAKWAHDLETPLPGDAAPGFVGALAARMIAAASESPPGPAHLNLRFREPLVPGDEIVSDDLPVPRVALGRLHPDRATVTALARLLAERRGLLVCGPQDDPALPAAAAALAAAAGMPIFADPLSQVRAGAHDLSRVIPTADHLATAGVLEFMAPEVVLRVGALPTSKPVWQWLGAHPEVLQVVIDTGDWRDPTATVALMVRADPVITLQAVAAGIARPAPSDWLNRWRRVDRAAAGAVERVLDGTPFPSEPEVVRVLGSSIPAGALLWVASSMPVRDVDAFFPARIKPVRFAANRGAAGIDGFISSGLGSAAVSGRPTYLLAGDLSLLHDLTALVAASRLQIPATIVVAHNDGGGIFHFLPQAGLPEHFESLFGTPHGLDFVGVATALGIPARRIATREELAAEVARPPDGPLLLEVRTDRAENFAVHMAVREAVATSVAGL